MSRSPRPRAWKRCAAPWAGAKSTMAHRESEVTIRQKARPRCLTGPATGWLEPPTVAQHHLRSTRVRPWIASLAPMSAASRIGARAWRPWLPPCQARSSAWNALRWVSKYDISTPLKLSQASKAANNATGTLLGIATDFRRALMRSSSCMVCAVK